MAGHALAIADAFGQAQIVGIEPEGADDCRQSLSAGERVRIDQPTSICDGLCSYEVGEHNWPILQAHLNEVVVLPDAETQQAMRWIYQAHGLRVEPSGAIAVAAALSGRVPLAGEGDVVIVVSGRNVDEDRFLTWIDADE